MIKELSTQEIEMVNGGLLGLLGIPAASGLLVTIPTIVSGAVTGDITSGLGYTVMTAGIVGTVLSSVAILVSLVVPVL